MENPDPRLLAKKLESPTSLTEFAPLLSEVKPPTPTFSFRRLFWKPKEKPKPEKEEKPAIEEIAQPSTSFSAQSHSALLDTTPSVQPVPETSAASTQDRDRSMATILRRISNLLDRSDNTMLQDYNESDFKQYWMPDSNCRECYECGDKFTAFRRRHHCRICGQIFCSRCCNQGIPGKIMGYLGDLRACTYCCKVVLAYIRSLDSDLSSDVRTLKESLQLKFGTSPPASSAPSSPFWSSSIKRKSSMGFREEDIAKAKLDVTPSEHSLIASEKKKTSQENLDISDLWIQVQATLLFRSYKYRQRWFDNSISGSSLVDWFISNGHAPNRPMGVRLGQNLVDQKYLRCAFNVEQPFFDSPLPYTAAQELNPVPEDEKPKRLTSEVSQDGHEPLWFKEIQMASDNVSAEPHLEAPQQPPPLYSPESATSFFLDMDIRKNRVCVSRPPQASLPTSDTVVSRSAPQSNPTTSEYNVSGVTASEFLRDILYGTSSLNTAYFSDSFHSKNWHNIEKLSDENGEKAAFDILEFAYNTLEHNLLRQLLDSEGLASSWEDVILYLVQHSTAMVHPEIRSDNDDLDIRQYIKVKKIPGGTKDDCEILRGVAWTKNVAHRKMRQDISNPSILLLSTPIVYQRSENKLSSLEPIIMQEREYLKNIVLKIVMFKPDVLVVEKNVSRLAQDLLLKMGITLIYNVTQNVMERIARFTKAQLTTSIDAHLGQPIRGTCKQFRVQDFTLPNGKTKTLLIFDGCHTEQGCTILLRGGSLAELKRVKKIIQFLIYTAYNWRLEKSFLMDEYAMPPLGSEDMVLEEFKSSSSSKEVVTSVVRPEKADLEISHSTSHLELIVGSREQGKDALDGGRKMEKKYVEDFSDPLRSYLQMGDDQEAPNPPSGSHLLRVASLPLACQFRKGLDGTVLCSSPFITISLPFLETEQGKSCKLRQFFPEEIYWSRQFEKDTAVRKSLILEETSENQEAPNLGYVERPAHPFIHNTLSEPLSKSTRMQSMLAEFRACGEKYRRVWNTQPNNGCNGFSHQLTDSSSYRETPMDKFAGQLDVLSPFNHQKLSVLFCSHSYASNNAPNFCVDPWVVHMDFYGSNDITLGAFLERYCFNTSHKCHSCDAPMTEHIRKFVHDTGSVQIMLQKMEKPIAATLNGIFLWSWCTKCHQHTPISKMSREAWTYSFAKYLELRFHGSQYVVRGLGHCCAHSLHQTYIQYFAHKNIVVTFSYLPITLREVDFPPVTVTITERPVAINAIVEDIKCLSKKGYEVFNLIKEKLNSLQQDCADSQSDQTLNDMNECHQKESAIFRSLIEKIQLLVTSSAVEKLHATAPVYPNIKEACETMWIICNDVVMVKMYIAEAVHNWNNKIENFVYTKKKEEKAFKIGPQPSKAGLGFDTPESVSSCQLSASEEPLKRSLVGVPEESASRSTPVSDGQIRSKSLYDLPSTLAAGSLLRVGSAPASLWSSIIPDHWPSFHLNDMRRFKKGDPILRHRRSISQIQERELTDSSSTTSSTYTPAPTLGLCSAGLYPTADFLNNDTYVLLHHKKSNPLSGSQSTRHERSRSDGSETVMTAIPSKTRDEEAPANKKPTMKTLLSILLNSPAITPIPSPFPPTEHLLLPPSDKVPIVVYDDDPGSLIAYVLTSKDYETQLLELSLPVHKDGTSTGSPLLKKRTSKMGALDTGSSIEVEVIAAESSSPRPVVPSPENKQLHIEVQASEPTLHIYCKVYFAEHFRRLRALILPQGEERFIRSLASCIPWAARGGKSGSKFRKTKDDRFVLKEMSKLEIQSFMEFGPHYLNYIYKACTQQMPSVLGKILGVYRIGYKNAVNNASHRADVLVMENLFYGRSISQKFDLKGSVRNRLVSPNTRQDPGELVLLDENLLKMSCDCPLYIRPHSKTVLTLAINNDARFLCEQSVMDYSLLVGLDDQKKELVVGIIDYIRTFTWDKKLEMVVKSSGILGGHGKLPTVVSPEIYQSRFCEAMDRYFLYVPDRWFTLGKDVAH